jgi:hypothetical protein
MKTPPDAETVCIRTQTVTVIAPFSQGISRLEELGTSTQFWVDTPINDSAPFARPFRSVVKVGFAIGGGERALLETTLPLFDPALSKIRLAWLCCSNFHWSMGAGGGISEHVVPSPVKPAPHLQVRPPGVLVQVALGLQPPFPVKHSLVSLQVSPSPENPDLHAQVLPPLVFVQMALVSQPPLPVVHSLTSLHVSPSPE